MASCWPRRSGWWSDPPAAIPLVNDARPERIAREIDGSLARLRTDVIDLYYLHRVDPAVPLEESWGAMAELVDGGEGAGARTVRGERRGTGACAGDPSRRGGAVGALALDARSPRRCRAVVLRARRRLRAVRAPRPWLPHGDDHVGLVRRRGLPREEPPLHRRGDRGEPRDRGPGPRRRRSQRRHRRAGGAGLAPGPGSARRPDPGHQAPPLPGGERGRRRTCGWKRTTLPISMPSRSPLAPRY